ncbi:E3 ubiquitin-protein ligase CCNB1IP1-like [Neocloeon triangulifer]|uniref:E3 ubiquitin-protein ligase CCNB1IP1-like n=1 Tax=Neocloeon triangulifer TaxID=2078957 RepID=UPI00286F9840|nr:E3 ubiquitin-protein ligase CCNB1IP1-like [Neocloeon triangulifer]
MADSDLICNSKSCLKPLKKTAWVTSCSHVFCQEDGIKELRNSPNAKCPVCGTPLNHSSDIVKADLNPSEHFKSMVLTGLSPEIVMDIVNRSFSFWTYQNNLTKKYQESVIKSYKEKLSKLESSYEILVAKIQQEVCLLKKKVEELEREKMNLLNKLEESAQKMAEKNRENQKLHSACNAIRKANLHSSNNQVNYLPESSDDRNVYSITPKTMNDLLPRRQPSSQMHLNVQMQPGNFTPRRSNTQTMGAPGRRKQPDIAGFSFKPVAPIRDSGSPLDFTPFMAPKAPRMDK